MTAIPWLAGAMLLLFAIGALGAIAPRGRALVYPACLACCAAIGAIALGHLLGGAIAPQSLVLPVGLPWLGAHLRLDALSAFFLSLVGLGGGAASLFGIGYGRHGPAPQRVVPFFPAFIGAMGMVVLADDAFTFLLCWELMSVLSWALVLARHREAASARAGFVYLAMASSGTLTLLLAFGLMAGSEGSYAFDAIRQATHGASVIAPVLGLTLLGAGSKAGLVPVHVWLPLAHPAAPSHVSALMSGVMTKIAVYGFIRVAFDLMAAPPWWAGMVLLWLGGITAVLGILHALLETDLKRVLACSTIENIGVVFAGLGLALAFKANAMGGLAALSLSATLFHMLNHALFKSLLFFGAGSVLAATGLRDIDRLGGLIHRLPVTAFAFLGGSVAIAALPPLNGFASEWLLFQSILQSPALPQWGLKIAAPAVGGLLALAAALAAACFVRAFGVAFLGRPRTPEAAGAAELDRFSHAAMILLLALCVLGGIFPGQVIDALAPVAAALVQARVPYQGANAWLTITPVPAGASSYNGLLLLCFIAASAALAAALVHRLASRALRRGPAWGAASPILCRWASMAGHPSPSRSGACWRRHCSPCASGWRCRRPVPSRQHGSRHGCVIRSGCGCTQRWPMPSALRRTA